MNATKKYRRFLILMLVAVMVIPVLAATAYASPRYAYNFNFGGGRTSVTGTKTDYGYSAGVSVLQSNLNGGYVRFQLFGSRGETLSPESEQVWGYTSSCPVYYYEDCVFNGNRSITMRGNGYGGAISVSGNFVP